MSYEILARQTGIPAATFRQIDTEVTVTLPGDLTSAQEELLKTDTGTYAYLALLDHIDCLYEEALEVSSDIPAIMQILADSRPYSSVRPKAIGRLNELIEAAVTSLPDVRVIHTLLEQTGSVTECRLLLFAKWDELCSKELSKARTAAEIASVTLAMRDGSPIQLQGYMRWQQQALNEACDAHTSEIAAAVLAVCPPNSSAVIRAYEKLSALCEAEVNQYCQITDLMEIYHRAPVNSRARLLIIKKLSEYVLDTAA